MDFSHFTEHDLETLQNWTASNNSLYDHPLLNFDYPNRTGNFLYNYNDEYDYNGYGYDPNLCYTSVNVTDLLKQMPWYYISIHIVLPIICSVGILGIILTVIVLSHKNMSTSTNSYLISLAMADLCFLIIMPLMCFESKLGRLETYYYLIIRFYAFNIMNIFLLASVWLTVMLAVERYIAICHPLRAMSICTITRARIIIVLIFVISALLHVPQFLTHTVEYFHDPCVQQMVPHTVPTPLGMDARFRLVDKWMNNALIAIIPFILLVTLNGCLIREIHRSTNYLRYHLASDSNVQTIITGEEIKITMMLISVVVVFFICQGPYILLNVIKTIHPDIIFQHFHALTSITVLLLALRSSFNFILYCWFSEKFWNTFKRTFCKSACIMSRAPTWLRSRVWNNSEHGNSNNNRKTSHFNTKETTC